MPSLTAFMGLQCVYVFGFLACLHWTAHASSCRTTPVSDVVPTRPAFLSSPSTPTLYTEDQEGYVTSLPMWPQFEPNGRGVACPWNKNPTTLKWWHDPSTWGGTVPAANTDVTLPANTRVIATDCSFLAAGYNRITIPSTSELIFMDAPITLTAKEIVVNGKFLLGNDTCRLFASITINLVATKDEAATYNGGILVSGPGSELQMHGKQFHPSWTRLAGNLTAGSTVAWLQRPVNWEVGQRVLITTSTYRDATQDQNEVMTIRSVSSDGKRVEFTQAVKYLHYAGSEYQTEVALLSRRITVQSPKLGNGWGGHMMCMAPDARCRWSGVYATGLGQTNMLGRYPFHFHHTDATPTATNTPTSAWVTDCVCETTNYRCVVVHGWNQTWVARNVAYNITGHSSYLEDGVEEENFIEFNLAARIHTIYKNAAGVVQSGETVHQNPDLTQPSDVAAAGFYFPNMRNYIRGNAASGGWTGFAFPILPRPIGSHKSYGMNPSTRPGLEFRSNTAHSSGYFWSTGAGACMYSGGYLTYNASGLYTYNTGRNTRDTMNLNGSDTSLIISNTKVWLCHIGVNMWGERMDIVNFQSHDCGRSVQLFGESSLTHALIEGRSRNPVAAVGSDDFETTVQGFQMYDTRVKTILYNITFRNFTMGKSIDTSVWTALTVSDIFKPWYITGTAKINYVNVDTRIVHKRPLQESSSYRMFNFIDWDGTATLRGNRACKLTIVGSSGEWWNAGTPDCYFEPDWQTWICDRIVGREIGNLEFLAPGYMVSEGCGSDCMDYQGETLTQAQRNALYVGWVAQVGYPSRKVLATKNRGTSGYTGMGWFPYWDAGTPRNLTIRPRMVARGQYIIVAVRYNSCAAGLQVWLNHFIHKKRVMTMSASMDAFLQSGGMNYYTETDSLGCIVWLKIVNMVDDYATSYYERQGIRIWREQWPGLFDYFITVGDGVGSDVLTPPSGQTADVFVPPVQNYPRPKCPNGESDLIATVDKTPWKYRYSCSPEFTCPGSCTTCTAAPMCTDWKAVSTGVWAPTTLLPNTACSDNNVLTVNDRCSSTGVCQGVDEKTVAPMIFSGLQQWYLLIIVVPSDNTTLVTVTDNRGTTKSLTRQTAAYQRERWISSTGTPFYGDVTAAITMSWGTTFTSVFYDINKVANKDLTLTKKSTSATWLQVGVTPYDYVRSCIAVVRGYNIPLIPNYESFQHPTDPSAYPAGFDKKYYGDITFKFTMYNGTEKQIIFKNWEPKPSGRNFTAEELVMGERYVGNLTEPQGQRVGARVEKAREKHTAFTIAVTPVAVGCVIVVVIAALISRRRTPTLATEPGPAIDIAPPITPIGIPTVISMYSEDFAPTPKAVRRPRLTNDDDEFRLLTPASLSSILETSTSTYAELFPESPAVPGHHE